MLPSTSGAPAARESCWAAKARSEADGDWRNRRHDLASCWRMLIPAIPPPIHPSRAAIAQSPTTSIACRQQAARPQPPPQQAREPGGQGRQRRDAFPAQRGPSPGRRAARCRASPATPAPHTRARRAGARWPCRTRIARWARRARGAGSSPAHAGQHHPWLRQQARQGAGKPDKQQPPMTAREPTAARVSCARPLRPRRRVLHRLLRRPRCQATAPAARAGSSCRQTRRTSRGSAGCPSGPPGTRPAVALFTPPIP